MLPSPAVAAPVTDEQVDSTEPLLVQIRSFSGTYWTANWMELVERFAYYGVRVVLPVFMVLGIESGGPELTHEQKGSIFAIWALVQSFVPIFTGGFADRYGFKVNIAISTCLKIVGYLVMGFCIQIAEAMAGKSLHAARAAGEDHVYGVFFAGAMLLALGTAIFKPGVQGLIANRMPKGSASLGWAMFYQMVNVGGFVGPLLAGYLRVLEWEYVFIACASGIALNFIPLFLFREPPHHGAPNSAGPMTVLVDAVRGLLEPRLFFFTIAFSGFWLMFYQLFDILPNFIDDWIDSRAAAGFLISLFGHGGVPTTGGGNLTQEWMINVNALIISLFAFLGGRVTGKLPTLTAIVVGIAISAAAIYSLGMSMNGWWTIGAIGLFSLGEMSASPTQLRYIAAIAPPGKEGLYLGYSNMTVGMGWSVGSVVAGHLYQETGDKVELARRYLVEHAHVSRSVAHGLDRTEVLDFFGRTLHVDPWQTRQILWDAYEPYGMWLVFTLIGLASMLLLVAYNYITRRAAADPNHSFNTRGRSWVICALVPIVLGFAYAGIVSTDPGAVWVLASMFGLILVAALWPAKRPSS